MELSQWRILTLVIISILFLITPIQINFASALDSPSDLNSGPYIDEAVYRVVTDQDLRALAMQSGEIDMDCGFYNPVYYEGFRSDGRFSIVNLTRNGYGLLTINCRDPPLNETVLRRAFAFAFDKTRVTWQSWDGWSQEHDSVVPYVSRWCSEKDLPWHYYTSQPEIGNALLNASGIFPYGPDGWRTYKGQPIEKIEIEYPSPVDYAARIAADALHSLGIPARSVAANFADYISRVYKHLNYDIVFYATNYNNTDVDWLAYQYWSENANIPYRNPSNFKNESYDRCREQLLHGATDDEIYNASFWMQKILHEQVPVLIVYQNIYYQAYKTDAFTGHVPDLHRGIAGLWTMRKLHKIGSVTGGTVKIAIGEDISSFNIFQPISQPYWYHLGRIAILEELWPALYSYDPEGRPWPYIAKRLITETHADNPGVPVGHTRFTMDIIENATWSDGVPLTANDIAFTFIYLHESGQLGPELSNLCAVYAPHSSKVVFEFSTESYWHFTHFAFHYIIPEHIFNNETGIGYDGWNNWNPVINPDDPHVTAGPFLLTDFDRGNYYTLSFNPAFAYAIPRSSETFPTTTDNSTYPTQYAFTIAAILSGASTCIITVMASEVIRSKWSKRE